MRRMRPSRARIFWRSRIRGGRWSRRLKRFLGRCRWGERRRKRASNSDTYPFDPESRGKSSCRDAACRGLPAASLPCVCLGSPVVEKSKNSYHRGHGGNTEEHGELSPCPQLGFATFIILAS